MEKPSYLEIFIVSLIATVVQSLFGIAVAFVVGVTILLLMRGFPKMPKKLFVLPSVQDIRGMIAAIV